jgi:peptide/nickel transport system substrate-binding protein
MIFSRDQKQRDKRFTTGAALITLLALLSLCFFASCSKETNGYGGEVTIPVLNRIGGLHPLIDRSVENAVIQLLFSPLVDINETLEPSPGLAESWIVSDDGLYWDFSLRKNVRFHDGESFTSDDVVFTLEEILGNPDEYSMSPLYSNIASVSAVDEHTVRIALQAPYAPLLQLLTVEILPSHILRDDDVASGAFGRNPVGTGPFKFSSWDGDTITLTANDEYFEGRPHIDNVVLKHLSDKTAAWSELMQGKVSIVTDLDPEDYEVIESDERFATYSYLDFFYYTVLLNNQDPLFGDKDIRRAMSFAIDRKKLIEEALSGWGDTTTGPFIPGTWPYDENVTGGFDPEKAVNLLDSAGWSDTDGDGLLDRAGEKFVFELLIDEGDVLKEAVAQSIKWQLFRIGIQVDVTYLGIQVLLRERLSPGNYQAAVLQFNAGDPDSFTYLFWHSSRIGASNLARYENPEVDGLIELGQAESDTDKRRAAYRGIHRLMAADTPSVFLFVRRIYMGATSRVEGFKAQPQLFFSSAHDWKIRAH